MYEVIRYFNNFLADYQSISPKGGVMMRNYELMFVVKPTLEEEATKNVVENITYNKGAKNIRDKVQSAQRILEPYLTVKHKSKNKTYNINTDSCKNSELECEQIWVSYSAVRKQIRVISESYPVVAAISLKVGKAVNNASYKRVCIEQKE